MTGPADSAVTEDAHHETEFRETPHIWCRNRRELRCPLGLGIDYHARMPGGRRPVQHLLHGRDRVLDGVVDIAEIPVKQVAELLRACRVMVIRFQKFLAGRRQVADVVRGRAGLVADHVNAAVAARVRVGRYVLPAEILRIQRSGTVLVSPGRRPCIALVWFGA